MNLSKSLYVKGIQCSKSLWLKKYKTEVLTPPNEATLAIFSTGNYVGELACKLFPDGKEVPFSSDYDSMITTTKEWIDTGIKNIYEATFNYNGILVMVDILEINDDGVNLYEVKSSTSVSDIYRHDASIQYYVLKNLGFNIKTVNIIHINNQYVRGDVLNLNELFQIVNVTKKTIELQNKIPETLQNFQAILNDKVQEPNINIGPQCNKPYECDAKNYCWKIQKQIPEYSIFNIFNLGSKKQIELYSQGIKNIEDIPDNFIMTDNQSQAVQNYKSKQTFIDAKKIKEHIDTFTYPIYHLDFETFQQAIPKYNGLKPFEQIPFQYSLHIEQINGELEHKEFLAEDGIDPREQIAKRLCEDIPDNVTVLAYNMSFEKGVIKRLASNFEGYTSQLLAINENMKDLMIPFQKKYYVTPNMKGSYSIKYVLPALVPEMQEAYKKLIGVQNGSEAMNAFAKMEKMEEKEKQQMRTALIEYCKLDTLAMVKILGKLKEVTI